MKILIVGAGALGGYFGARLLQAKQDVTFLLRPRRIAQLEQTGLVVKSPLGDAALPMPPHVQAADLEGQHVDLVIVACKAYDLAQTMESFAPAVGAQTAILPLLNGIAHLDQLVDRFGEDKVLGGLCMISATLDDEGVIHHLNDAHVLAFGEIDGVDSARVRAVGAAFAEANFTSKSGADIMLQMWEKWVFIASAAGITSLMRGTVGDIVAAGGTALVQALIAECAAIATANDYAPRPPALERARTMLTQANSPISASMAKDIDKGAPVEADHVIGDLIARAAPPLAPTALLNIAYVHLKAYEARRAREA
jgi:2-dehydropantoate 2-reductase